MPEHDRAYKLLFSHPEMVRDLLEGFVREDWLAELDYTSLERVNCSYVSDDLRGRADDVVWRVRWGEGWVYIYLLIEFQSTVERYMAVRILTYVALLYQDLIRARQLSTDGRLPPVLPIVLYNGAARWSAALDVESLLQRGPKALAPYAPRARYLLIDEGRYRQTELEPLRNLVAALFRLETSRNQTDVRDVLISLVQWLKSPEQASLRRAFMVWINKTILMKMPGGPVANVEDLNDMGTILEARIQEWAEQARRKGHEQGQKEGRKEGRKEGHQEGLQEGHQEGLRRGEAQLLERQLRKRFGRLPRGVLTRLQQAPPAELERWGERLLEVDSLDEVFDTE